MAEIREITFEFKDNRPNEVFRITEPNVDKLDINHVGNMIGVVLDVLDETEFGITGGKHVELTLWPMADISKIVAKER